MSKVNRVESKVEKLDLLIKDYKNNIVDIQELLKDLTLEELIVADKLVKKLLKLDFFIDNIPFVEWLNDKFSTDEYTKFVVRNNYKVDNEKAIHWAIRKNMRFGNIHALEWIIIYCSSVDSVKTIEWSIKNNIKIGNEPVLKWITEVGINKEYFINYSIINDCKVGDITALEWIVSERNLNYNKIIKICDKKGIKIDNKSPLEWAKIKNLI